MKKSYDIHCFGCSMTAGVWKNIKSYPQFLSEMTGSNVINNGKRGCGLQKMINIYNEVSPKKSLCVIQLPTYWRVPCPEFENEMENGCWKSFYRFYRKDKNMAIKFAEKIFDEELEKTISFANRIVDDGNIPVFLLYNYNNGKFSYYRNINHLPQRFFEELEKKLTNMEVLKTEMIHQREMESLGYVDFGRAHPNEHGNKRLAEAVCKAIGVKPKHLQSKNKKTPISKEIYPLW